MPDTLHGDDESIEVIDLVSPDGTAASVLTWGATLHDLRVPTANGASRRVVHGYRNLDNYRANPFHMGATAGRNANRIAGARFVLDGATYQLERNDANTNNLHGGSRGFGRRQWTTRGRTGNAVELVLVSPAGDQGFPGEVTTVCRYELVAGPALRVTMTATTTEPTIVNLTHHSYFTLSEGGDCRKHTLWLDADRYTPTDETLIPTGELRAVADTPFDFRFPREIGAAGVDLDTNFALNGDGDPTRPVARLVSPAGDLTMEVATNQPGLQVYTAVHLSETDEGLGGCRHGSRSAVCLETQAYPDAPNKPHFPQTVLRPGETYRHVVEYRFSI